jgi:hypothetical protein
MRTSESIKNLAQALNKAQAEMGSVTKGSDNPFYKSKFADINDVIKTVKGALNANGITYLQPLKLTEVAGKKVTVVETVLLHSSGEYMSSETEVVVKEGTDAQKFGASITYSRRFGLQSMIGLPAEDDDGNKASGKKLTTSPVNKTVSSTTKKENKEPPKKSANSFRKSVKPVTQEEEEM